MTARVLVVDDMQANIKLLQARLMAEYFEVLTATNGPDAIEIARSGQCDIILLDVMMPGMDGYEVCRTLKADALTAHIPVVMITALDQPSDKLEGLEAGADDFLTKPVADLPLLTRVRSLTRLKRVTDELQLRIAGSADIGIEGVAQTDVRDPEEGRNGKLLVVDDSPESGAVMHRILDSEHQVSILSDPHEALFRAADEDFDLVVLSLGIEKFDALRLCSQLRSLDRTRSVPILVLTGAHDEPRLMRAIEFGVNDYLARPVEPNELMARVRTQVKRKRLNDKLRQSVQSTMELAVRDALTGLSNRRYFDRQMESMFNHATVTGRPLSLIIVDIDHFKQVNDTYGHLAGDEVLRHFSKRLQANVRSKDLACRYGGEEFVVALPATDQQLASVVAERMRREIADAPIVVDQNGTSIPITISAGIASLDGANDTIETLLSRADEALYEAKRGGRNQVIAKAA